MAISDFVFWHHADNNNTAHGTWHINYRQANANGTSNSGAAGGAVVNSSLSNPLPSGIASTHARMYAFSKNTFGAGHLKGSGAVALVAAAQGGSNYPTSNNTSADYSYSCRAFLRINQGSAGATAAGGTNICLVHKTLHTNGSTQYSGQAGGAHSADNLLSPCFGVVSGYSVQLKTLKNPADFSSLPGNNASGGGAVGTNAAPILQIVAPNNSGDIDHLTDIETHTCTGTYAFNTWYHVRFDVYYAGGSDVLKVYTAPISDAGSADTAGIGNETWTEVGSKTISGAGTPFIAWNHSTKKYSGWAALYGQNSASTNNAGHGHDALIDRFQFLDKDIS